MSVGQVPLATQTRRPSFVQRRASTVHAPGQVSMQSASEPFAVHKLPAGQAGRVFVHAGHTPAAVQVSMPLFAQRWAPSVQVVMQVTAREQVVPEQLRPSPQPVAQHFSPSLPQASQRSFTPQSAFVLQVALAQQGWPGAPQS
jgi:hypothetical protein